MSMSSASMCCGDGVNRTDVGCAARLPLAREGRAEVKGRVWLRGCIKEHLRS